MMEGADRAFVLEAFLKETRASQNVAVAFLEGIQPWEGPISCISALWKF